MGQVLFAELGIVAVGDECDGAKIVVFLSLGFAGYTHDLAAMVALDEGFDSRFDDGNVGG